MDFPGSNEIYICVDVETSGPVPGDYSLLSIGACTVFEPRQTFYIELQPINENSTPEASQVHRLSFEHLMEVGVPPEQAMVRFEAWLQGLSSPGKNLLFVAFNAPFDWMFVNYYFHHYLRHNPFGHAAIDIKAFYMGLTGRPWAETSWRYIDQKYKVEQAEDQLTHHALQDALDQAELFKKMLSTAHDHS